MSLRKNETLTGWTLSQHICLHFWAWLLLYSVITPKSEDKYVQKCSTRQSFIFPKWHYYKIGTLTLLFFLSIDRSATLNLSNSISRLILAIPKRIAVRVFSFFSPGNLTDFDDYDRRKTTKLHMHGSLFDNLIFHKISCKFYGISVKRLLFLLLRHVYSLRVFAKKQKQFFKTFGMIFFCSTNNVLNSKYLINKFMQGIPNFHFWLHNCDRFLRI